MTLTLRIENYDVLENGGPPWITLEGKNACIGRGSAMDWILPDPARHISSHHFDITFKGGTYYLTDVSTNGTFLQGQRYRLDGAHEIRSGDRFQVGHYIVGATIMEPKPEPAPQAAPAGQKSLIQQPPTWAPTSANTDDPWDSIGRTSTPSYVPRAQPAAEPAPSGGLRQPPISQPPQPNPVAEQAPVQPMISQPPISQPPVQHTQAPAVPPPQPAPAPQAAPAPAPQAAPAPPPQPAPVAAPPAEPAPPPQPAQPAQPAAMPMPKPEATPVPAFPGPSPAPVPPPSPAAAAPVAGPASNADVFRAFCEGAGLDPSAYGDADMVRMASELGRCLRIATQEIMTMLQDRAAVKHFTRGGERTMRSATGNNPMKFMPDTEQAMETMFLKPRDGFMRGPDGFENALFDIRQHQGAVFAALQPALAQLLSGLSPDEIGGEAGGGIMGGGKSKSWDVFVERWDGKAAIGDNGMLDAFLDAFSKSYAEAIGKGRL